MGRMSAQRKASGRPDGKKKQILAGLFSRAMETGKMVFNTDDVLAAARVVNFKNPHDAVKIDRADLLPDNMRERDFYFVHLGEGRHKFVRGLAVGFHRFEPIPPEFVFPWKYRRSVLNQVDASEANILSVGMNQRILHDFLYEDIVAGPKVYNARRTKRTVRYSLGGEEIQAVNLQMELDMTCEYQGRVTVFEGKNGFAPDFAVYQLFHPFLYFTSLKEEGGLPLPIREIGCCYLLREQRGGETAIRVYLYEFERKDPASIALKRRAEYRLVER